LRFLSDKRILLGVGIGIILGSTIMSINGYTNTLKREQIESTARGYGMHYSDECKVIYGREVKGK
jgi:hypothetical protein